MVKRSVCFILTFVMIVCSLLTDNSVYAASKLTTLKVDKVYKQFDLDHDGKNEELKCHFCNTAYTFSVDELKELLKKSR